VRAPSHHHYTWRQYLELEHGSPIKHEFLAGEIFAMAGGTPEHAALGAAVQRDLGVQLKGAPCRAYSSDLSIRVQATGLATYPDATVVCGEAKRDSGSKNILVNPTVIVEVTSDSTESYDRTTKFEHYRTITELAEYVLVSHREPLIEVYRRMPDGDWTRFEARSGERARLQSIECELSVDEVYRGIALHTE
jgi:Uma2 family endonuclease